MTGKPCLKAIAASIAKTFEANEVVIYVRRPGKHIVATYGSGSRHFDQAEKIRDLLVYDVIEGELKLEDAKPDGK